ncbi:MAG: tetratricopeptide repeat protein [Alphaproteobacteria bacterium]|nr:tetratricopeptide repeat protein [Alphaproteobacteria bacterium]MBV9692697.1 tetratricopeptide repeat protein [Alphaproteobacteria bacterium]
MRIVVLAVAAAFGLAAANAEAALQQDGDALSYGAYLSARFAADEHDMADAARFYRESLERDPDDQSLMSLAFFYETSSGDLEDATALAKRLVAATPDDRAARLVLAVDAMKHGNYHQAREEIAKSAKNSAVNITVALVNAWAAAGDGDAAGALQAIDSLRGQGGAEGVMTFHKALLLEYLGRKAEAEAIYKDAARADGASPRLVSAYGLFLERSGRDAEAKAFYDSLTVNAAFSPIVEAARARLARGQRPAPLVARPQDGVAEALFNIGASLNEEASAEVSVLYLRLALYLRPDLDLGYIMLGDRLETLQKLSEAIDAFRKVDSSSPYRKLAAIEIATDEARLEKNDEAIRDLKALSDSDGQDVQIWSALGDSYRAANRFPDAVAAYDKGIAAVKTPSKKDWILYFSRAAAADKSGNWKAAEADLKQALVLSPDEPQVLNYLGYSWVDQGRNVPEALGMLERARTLKPYDGYIIDSVGWAYYKLGRYADAAKTLEDAILLVPGDPTINDHYGDALWKVGRKLEAQFQWNHAIAFGAEAAQKSEIEKKLLTAAQ